MKKKKKKKSTIYFLRKDLIERGQINTTIDFINIVSWDEIIYFSRI
jgi:hypothetical protein